jgi:hypothetical protein
MKMILSDIWPCMDEGRESGDNCRERRDLRERSRMLGVGRSRTHSMEDLIAFRTGPHVSFKGNAIEIRFLL